MQQKKRPNPPPSYAPKIHPPYMAEHREAVPRYLAPHLFHMIYVWMKTGQSFWMYPTALENQWIYGYLWNGRRWIYTRFLWCRMDRFC